MRQSLKKITALIAALTLFTALIPSAGADYTAPTSVIRVGLYNGSQKSYASANLQNVKGLGYGYTFGYYDSSRVFHDLGVSVTDTNSVTVSIDRNLVWDASSRSYKEGTKGDVTVGCFHLQLETGFEESAEASSALRALSVGKINKFLKYSSGKYYICIGDYISREKAVSAASELGLSSSWSVTSGTAYTVTVTETGTSRILFEFDYANRFYLAVRPIASGAEKAQTYFKNITYFGDFAYVRQSGGSITVVNYINIEDYLKGVVPNEMLASWPLEALKAQAVCARTYAMKNLNKHSGEGFDLCNTTDCQAYGGTSNSTANSNRAVDETKGVYLTYQGKLCEAYYYASNGGATESSENVWLNAMPYLVGKTDPYEAAVISQISNYNWTATFTGAQIASRLRARGYTGCTNIVKFEILEYTPSGNVLRIRFTDTGGRTYTFSKENCRLVLGLRSQRYTINGARQSNNVTFVNSGVDFITGLLTSAFAIGSGGVSNITGNELYAISGSGKVERIGDSDSSESSGNSFVVKGSGHGHNVGMSQWGAYSMARNYDMTYDEILDFYYTGAELSHSI